MTFIKTLYSKYYETSLSEGLDKKSEVTSSHWKKFGKENVRLINDEIVFGTGGGFGDFVYSTFYNRLKYIPQFFLINKYLLHHSNNHLIRNFSKDVAHKSRRIYSFDCAKHVIILEKTLESLNIKKFSDSEIKCIAVIGDGYGYFGNLLKFFGPEIKIIFINLGKQLIFDLSLSKKIHPKTECLLVETASDFTKSADMYFLEAENYHLLEGQKIDLFYNIVSMQEMNKSVVDQYFNLMRSSTSSNTYFFCLNREVKILPDGEKLIFDEYPWKDSKTIYEEANPLWYRKYPCNTPPFWRPFDGPMKVRLVKL